ncbi:MAG: type IX secretion system membrane protein PorP/SprF [Bacteroidota bacterium]
MNAKLFLVCICFFLLGIRLSHSQNEPFSQFYNSRLAVNPALTGHFINNWKIQDVFSYREYINGKFYSANNLSLELKIPIAKRSYFYGVVEEDYTNLEIGIGLTDDRHTIRHDSTNFSSDYLSLSVKKKLFKKAQISAGIQAGVMNYLSKSVFDLNGGLLFGTQRIDCEYSHQIFKYELGASYYHSSQPFRASADTLLFPSANIQLHGGAFYKISKKLNIEPMFHYVYNSLNYINAGLYLISRSKHPGYDGLRFGMFYRSTNHLDFAAGIRFFGKNQQSLSADLTLSYDLNLNGFYKNGIEVSLAVYPLRKCWKDQQCIPK